MSGPALEERLRKALTFDPDIAPEPIGRVRRKWWRLGWLSALAVARDRALGVEPSQAPWYVVEYDAENHALIATERLGGNDYGAASIVGHGVPPEWGHRIATLLSGGPL